MSTNIIDYNPNELDGAIDRRMALRSAHTVWYNPSTNLFHLDPSNSSRPNYDGPVMADYAQHIKNIDTARTKGASSSTIQDTLDFGHVSDEFQDLYVQMYDTWAQLSKQGKAKSAGVITMKDYASIASQIVSQEMLDLTVRDFALEGGSSYKQDRYNYRDCITRPNNWSPMVHWTRRV